MDSLDGTVTRTIFDDPARGLADWLSRATVSIALAAWIFACSGLASADTVPENDIVRFVTSAGDIYVDLFNQVTPKTIGKFLDYLDEYQDSIIHRAPANFVVQGGGYKTADFLKNPLPHSPTPLPFTSTIDNEFQISNTSGTIAMAQSGTPDSATTQWFFNTVNNTGLDGQKFTVFGQVISGMSFINTIQNPTVYTPSTVPFAGDTTHYFSNVPKKNSDGSFVNVSVNKERTHPAFQNPNFASNPTLALDVDNNGIISPADANYVINNLILNKGIHSATTYIDTRYRYVDTNGNGQISAADALKVINYLIHNPPGAQPAVSHSLTFSSLSPQTSVPEPSSWILGIIGAMALAGCAWRRHRCPPARV